jgi:sugar phosphate isomerase/epimerase
MSLLTRSYKGLFPFRVAAPSFIYPADYVPNAMRLGRIVDEIELLLFEGSNLPPRRTIEELGALAAEMRLGYNVHLPIDAPVAHPDPQERARSLAVMLEALARVEPLNPSAHILHVPADGSAAGGPKRLAEWRGRLRESLARILETGVDPARICVENLDYRLEVLDEVLAAAGVGICMDAGHLILSGVDPSAFVDTFGPRIRVVHLHAAEAGRDHLPLDRMPPEPAAALTTWLQRFDGVVSIEVFSPEALHTSLAWLAERLARELKRNAEIGRPKN